MRKISKIILLTIGSGVILAGLGLLVVNLYLQSSAVQSRIQDAASRVAGLPIRIQGTSFTPWSGVQVSGVSIPPGTDKFSPILDVSSVQLGIRFLSLLRGRLVIQEVLLTRPTFSAWQRPDGSWEIPQRYRSGQSLARSTPPPSSLSSAPTREPAQNTPPPTEKTSTPLQPVQINNLRLVDGKAQFFDKHANLAMSLDNITVKGSVKADGSASGYVRIRQVVICGLAKPHTLGSHFTWKNSTLDMPDITASWGNGTVTGSFHLDPPPGNHFTTQITASQVALQSLAEDAGFEPKGKGGLLTISGSLAGTIGQTDTFTGKADASLQEARLRPFQFIRQMGDLLQIDELKMLKLKKAEAHFSIHDSMVTTDSLEMESENLIIMAEGPTTFDGKVKIKAHLHINDKLRKNSFGLLGSNFEKSDREGYWQTPFNISGDINNPKTDLLDKLVGAPIGKNIGGLFRSLFGSGPSKPARDQEEEKPSTPSAP